MLILLIKWNQISWNDAMSRDAGKPAASRTWGDNIPGMFTAPVAPVAGIGCRRSGVRAAPGRIIPRHKAARRDAGRTCRHSRAAATAS
ncbi:hypothetical protein BOSE21B_110748 [Bosea sp. 21B]|nr:hypothetical protein BOSE21B_110748 [Bosea sp. 21B]CAD5277434.1 hypothetical protein BOSE7B_40470 [Bosea sp. 7B]VXC79285.1 hypothetical protein BOSE127_50176 [Bosea sp. 127]